MVQFDMIDIYDVEIALLKTLFLIQCIACFPRSRTGILWDLYDWPTTNCLSTASGNFSFFFLLHRYTHTYQL